MGMDPPEIAAVPDIIVAGAGATALTVLSVPSTLYVAEVPDRPFTTSLALKVSVLLREPPKMTRTEFPLFEANA
jgi:hypothetical protein